jgi:hypothetical protein
MERPAGFEPAYTSFVAKAMIPLWHGRSNLVGELRIELRPRAPKARMRRITPFPGLVPAQRVERCSLRFQRSVSTAHTRLANIGGPCGNRTHLTILLAKQATTPSSPTAQIFTCAAAAHTNSAAIRCGLSIETIRKDEDRSVEDNASTNLDCPGPEDAACRLGPSSTPRSNGIRDDAAQSLHRNQLLGATTDSACGGHLALQSACHPPRFSHPSPKRTGHDKICSRRAFLWTPNTWQLSFPSIGVAGGS